MNAHLRRRQFLQSASALGLGVGLGGLRSISPAKAAEATVGPDAVRFRPEIEPVVRWMEETPREKVFDVAVDHLRKGLSYRDLLAGLFLAGVRNVQPRPVGFKFHAVLVINSAHLLGQTAAVEDRLLPLFWALDNFKSAQQKDVQEGDWTLGRVDEAHLPTPGQAKAEFVRAMDAWDIDAADSAIASLCRNAGAAEVMEPLFYYGLRDHRDIGHKAIFAMQCWRTLQTVGWSHAEPVVRSLAYGLLDQGGGEPKTPVGPFDANLANASKIREGWTLGKPDPGATRALLETLRHASPEDASAEVVASLNRGVAPQSLWDAVTLHAGELMMRAPGILPIHAVTSANALHYIFGASGDDRNRRLALLQAAGWQPLYRDMMRGKAEVAIDALEPRDPEAEGDEAIVEIFTDLGTDRPRAAAKALGYLGQGGSPEALFAAARRLIFHKGRDSHDYKFGAAAWEEFRLASDPKWQAPLVAAALFNFPDTATPDSPLMERARAAAHRVGEVGS